jgi:flagellar biosynthetic protein FliR
MLDAFLSELTFHYFLVFCRVGSALMLLPGFGEFYVPARIRLLFALAVSLILLPVVEPLLPKAPPQAMAAFVVISGEVVAGLFIGALARILQSILHIAGMIIAFQSSLASAILFDASQGSQGSVVGSFMTIFGITLLFVTNLHHVLLEGLVASYQLFGPETFPPVDDFAKSAVVLMSESFLVALKISSPLVVVGLLVYLGSGMMSRLMPNMQVFFVIIPLQVLVSFYVLMISLSATMLWYLQHFESSFRDLFRLN